MIRFFRGFKEGNAFKIWFSSRFDAEIRMSPTAFLSTEPVMFSGWLFTSISDFLIFTESFEKSTRAFMPVIFSGISLCERFAFVIFNVPFE